MFPNLKGSQGTKKKHHWGSNILIDVVHPLCIYTTIGEKNGNSCSSELINDKYMGMSVFHFLGGAAQMKPRSDVSAFSGLLCLDTFVKGKHPFSFLLPIPSGSSLFGLFSHFLVTCDVLSQIWNKFISIVPLELRTEKRGSFQWLWK